MWISLIEIESEWREWPNKTLMPGSKWSKYEYEYELFFAEFVTGCLPGTFNNVWIWFCPVPILQGE